MRTRAEDLTQGRLKSVRPSRTSRTAGMAKRPPKTGRDVNAMLYLQKFISDIGDQS
jgi:hypothetical protein